MATTPKTFSAAKTKFSIATGAPATYDTVGFAAQVFSEIGKVKSGGEWGVLREISKNNYLSQEFTEKRPGTSDAGSTTLEVDLYGDAGQLACEAAASSNSDVTFKIALQNGDVYYLRGIVASYRIKTSGPNDMVSVSIAIEFNPIFLTGGTEVHAVKVPAP